MIRSDPLIFFNMFLIEKIYLALCSYRGEGYHKTEILIVDYVQF